VNLLYYRIRLHQLPRQNLVIQLNQHGLASRLALAVLFLQLLLE
jgi:hypothetical protein